MQLIPVLDLKGGQVVRAQQGRRDRYRPIVTPLSDSADPVRVAEGLRSLHPFSIFYVADLDAIEGRGSNASAIARLSEMPGRPQLWVDAGYSGGEALARALAIPGLHPVLGSESQKDETLLKRFRDHPDLVLSLDFFADGFRGPRALLESSELWPQRLIVMTLAKVGSATGPDFSTLAAIQTRAGDRTVIAAGGVRNEADLSELSSLGITAALIATSLHDGTLTAAQIAAFAR
jgi:phosphoribosylformimino-5-aminoimidazole carboxamide ribotide isomerase